MLLYIVVTSAAFTVLVEWGHYDDRFGWWKLPPQEELALLGILLSKSLSVLALPLILAALLIWGSWPRAAWTLLVSTLVGVFAWFGLDMHVNAAIGTHITDYLRFLTWHDWDLGGNPTWVLWPIAETLVRTGLLLGLAAWLFGRLADGSSRRRWFGTARGVVGMSTG